MSADMSDMEYDADDMTEDTQDDSFDLDEDIWDDNADLAEDDRMDLSANDSEWDLEEPDLEELRDPTIGEADLAVVREMEESGEFDEVLPVILAVSGQAEATAGRQRFISICR